MSWSCPCNYDFKACSSFESNNTDCGTCHHSEDLNKEELRGLLSIYLQSWKYLDNKTNELFEELDRFADKYKK